MSDPRPNVIPRSAVDALHAAAVAHARAAAAGRPAAEVAALMAAVVAAGEPVVPVVVRAVLKRWYGPAGRLRTLTREDLDQEGRIGLVIAARRYDPGRGCHFHTYAHWWVQKRVLGAIARADLPIRVAGAARTLGNRAYRAERRGAPLRLEPAAARTAVLARAAAIAGRGMRGGAAVLRCASPAESVVDAAVARVMAAQVLDTFRFLPPRQAAVLRSRIGLDGRGGLTLEEVAAELGVSRERARQVEADALARVRARLVAQGVALPDDAPGAAAWGRAG